jgi:hypothetical protein
MVMSVGELAPENIKQIAQYIMPFEKPLNATQWSERAKQASALQLSSEDRCQLGE